MSKSSIVTSWTCQKQEGRARREQEFAARIATTNAFRFEKVYGVIQTDDLHRPALPAAKDCVLFLWAVPPALPDALRAMEAWRFSYRSCWAWVKDQPDPPDPGAWLSIRRSHELILVGRRGCIPAPAPGQQFPSMFTGENGRAVFAGMVAQMFPSTPCLDLWASSPAVPPDIRNTATRRLPHVRHQCRR